MPPGVFRHLEVFVNNKSDWSPVRDDALRASTPHAGFRVFRLGPMAKAPNISPVKFKPSGSSKVWEAMMLESLKARRLKG